MGKLEDFRRAISGEPALEPTYSSEHTYENLEEATNAFVRATAKLYDVNKWSSLPGINSKFQLFDRQGNEKNPPKPEVGDFIRILLPGPVPENWVVVTHVRASDKSAEFSVSPSTDPNELKGDSIDHFFDAEAISIFRVELKDRTLYGYEIGENEGANNSGREAGGRKVINTLISAAGWAGFQQFQWTKLTDYFVHKIESTDSEL